MQLCAFVFLEDISGELPPYEETYLSVPMDAPLREAYRELEEDPWTRRATYPSS